LRPIPFHKEIELPGGGQVKLRRAGHILGAANAELHWGGKTIVFSGDIGRYGDPFMLDPEPVAAADYVLVESTYGDRTHPKNDPMEALGDVIEKTVRRGGTVIIPAFAVGRAQLIMYYLWKLKQAGRIKIVPIFLDSPMAINATDLLCRHLDDHRLSPDVCKQSCDIATYLREVDDSKRITRDTTPKVVIAASGMLTGGRVLHHLKAFGQDSRNTILFSGYQAGGTRGEKLLNGAESVKMFGQWFPIRAEIASLPALSAHADSDEILKWLSGFKHAPARTFVVHGEPKASDALRMRIGEELGWNSTVVDSTDRYFLEG